MKVNYVDGESFCRYNGVLMNPENMKKTFGFNGELEEIEINDKTIIIMYGDDDLIYVDSDNIADAIYIYLYSKSYETTSVSYDNALDEAHGFSKEHKNKILEFKHVDEIPNIRVLTKEQKSKFKIDEYFEFLDEIDLSINKMAGK
jgi:hypothetical protein